jgi:hypothetical protein
MVQGLGIGVMVSGLQVQGALGRSELRACGCRVWGLGFRVWGLGLRVKG